MNGAFRDYLKERLSRALPGREAQSLFCHEISYGRHFGPAPLSARSAAVLLLLTSDAEVVLTVRSEQMSSHGGQISFPGGRLESAETAEAAALRENFEELGISPEHVDLCGRLSPLYTYASNFVVQPVVAVLNALVEMRPNPAEVARVLTVPLTHLQDATSVETRLIRRSGYVFETRGFCYDSDLVWGTTAMILAEFLEVIAESPGG